MARNIAYQPGYGTFNGTNQYLSVASNAGLQTGAASYFVAGVANLSSLAGEPFFITKGTTYGLRYSTANRLFRWYGTSSDVLNATTFGSPSTGVNYFVMAGRNATTGQCFISVNGGAIDTVASVAEAVETGDLRIGVQPGPANYMNGGLSGWVFGKPDFSSVSIATIRDALWNGGRPLAPLQITAAQRTAWGVVSGWLSTSLLGDDIGSNTLTNNNTVTFAAPSARAIASNRRLINTATLTGAATVDATGLFAAISVDENASAGWYGKPTATSGGVPVILGTPLVSTASGGYRTWTYPVTSGNPSGNPILAGSTVVVSYAWGTWVKNGVGNTAGSVTATNGSTAVSSILTDLMGYWTLDSVLTDSSGNGNTLTNGNAFTFVPGKVGNGANFDRVSSQYAAAASNASLQTGNIDFTGWFWINIGALSISAGGSLVLMQKGASGSGGAGNYEYSVLYSGTGVDRFRIFMSSGGSEGGGNDAVFGPVTANIWNFVVFWYDSVNNLIGLQINNGTATTFSWAPGPQTVAGPLNIAGQGAVQNIQGIMDEIGFRKRLLTDAEKAVLYNYGNGRTYPFNW